MRDSAAERGPYTLGDYLQILRRRKWAIICVAALATVLALVFAMREQKVYRAQTSVLLNRTDLASSVLGAPQDPTLSEDPARYASDAAALARSSGVAQLAVNNAHVLGATPGQLLAQSSVTPDPNADALDFSVDDSNPSIAARLVNAYALAYTDYSLAVATSSLTAARKQLTARLAALAKSGGAGTAQYRTLAATEQRLHTMALLQSRDTVLHHPTGGSQIRPTPTKDALLGLGFGILAGIALAFVLEAVDKRVRSEEEIEHELGLPLLARVPKPSRGSGMTILNDSRSAHADGIRRLATRIAFASPDRRDSIVMVTSALEREGKSTTVANVAVALALSGYRVAAVDLDLVRPTLASLFEIQGLVGVTEVVMGQADLGEALAPIALPEEPGTGLGDAVQRGSLLVLASGLLPAGSGELVASDALVTRVLAPLRKRFDFVLIDSPPMCVVGDAATLAARVDCVVVVARPGLVDRGAIRDLGRQLAASPAHSLGFVLTDVSPTVGYGYGAYRQSGKQRWLAASNGNGSRRKRPERV